MISKALPNGVNRTYEYDGMSRLTRLKDVNSSATLFDRQYGYNPANQIGQITGLAETKNFGYDNIDRLTSVSDAVNGNESYTFNSVGNRTASHLSSTYSYQPFNKIASTQTAAYGSDANGNMTTKGEGSNFWRYTWDYENRMTQASTRKQSVRYKYDALGRRVQRHTPGSKENTKFTHDGLDVLIDDDKGIPTKYQNGPGIDNKLRQTTGSNVGYFLADHLGSTNGLADSSGVVTASQSYDSFGNGTNATFPSRYQFTGRELDSFSGLQFSRARFYDPNLGRFISEDPIGFGGGHVNLYGYVKNRPLMYRDSRGLFPDGDVLNPNTIRTLGPGAAALAALAGPEIAGAAVGAALIYGASYVGAATASHPSNPFVNGPLNPFPYLDNLPYPIGNPFVPSQPLTPARPYCLPTSRIIPFPTPKSGPLIPPPPTKPPDGRDTQCKNALADCLASAGGDFITQGKCAAAYNACIQGFPTIFPNGVVVR
ncbi:MAG: RHS repeat domain-containing protein [Pyrinomonadaceae bacterium]